MDLTIIAVGDLHEKYFRQGADEYKKRLSSKFCVKEIEIKEEKIPKGASEAQIAAALDKEADAILAAIPKRAFATAMCIEGKQYSSAEFARMFEDAAISGTSSFCFIIGSSNGLSDKVKFASNVKLSMSKMTFPHQLARVMLYEAVYRAQEILRGSGYHK